MFPRKTILKYVVEMCLCEAFCVISACQSVGRGLRGFCIYSYKIQHCQNGNVFCFDIIYVIYYEWSRQVLSKFKYQEVHIKAVSIQTSKGPVYEYHSTCMHVKCSDHLRYDCQSVFNEHGVYTFKTIFRQIRYQCIQHTLVSWSLRYDCVRVPSVKYNNVSYQTCF